ncbi:L-threonylcarbamoyladenylate synthase [Saliphagus infecundisoli]|uniref:L-threonylcarbamoyladenylate synthase n=1 Tax=Saliphagus infecundisoli TaxID=1849069 RepID=A0ABD5QCW8_9EURY|nr:L-threonylcarbamoyladenylate synthase [Saliphagus infecundisoli]
MDDFEAAVRAIERGELVVYPTETVYGLGADATDSAAVERVFEAKGRDRSKPVSVAVGSVDRALEYVRAGEREERFMRAFLPGPVTVVCRHGGAIPDVLTAGGDRVGVRVPDCEPALALAERAGPITATSANRSGEPSVRRAADLDPTIREAVAVVLADDPATADGEAPPSTVVDVEHGRIHRRGALAERVEGWLAGETQD